MRGLGELLKILDYKNIAIEECQITVQSVNVPVGKGRLYLTKDTAATKNCIITIKNSDTICLARAVVTAFSNIKTESWSKTQIQDGFNKLRKLQRDQALKLHEEADVEINDLEDVNEFANHLNVEINIIDSEQFNEIIYTANKGCYDKSYVYKSRNHFDVIKSMTAFCNVAYYCHDCKKTIRKTK